MSRAELVRLRSPHPALDLAVRDLAASSGAKQPRNHFSDMAQNAGNIRMVVSGSHSGEE